MDQSAFDRIARLLGAAATRRRGLAAAASLLVSGFAAVAGVPEARGRNRHPGLEGPCGDGTRKDNICTRNADCCTNICNLELGKKNVDRKGRCRCMRRGQPCKADRNCCNTLTCNGEVCGEAVVCTVCASGCPYTTVLAAIAGEPDGAVITIEPGTYPGDYPIVKTVTLVRCGDAGEVILTNQSAPTGLLPWEQGRVLWMGTYPESAPAETRQPRPAGIVVTLDSISVVGNSAFPLGGGIWVGVGATLTLLGDTAVRGARQDYYGAGIWLEGGALIAGCDRVADPACTDNVVIGDANPVLANIVIKPDGFPYSTFGGGIATKYNASITLRGNARVIGNSAEWDGGLSVRDSTTGTITDDAMVSGNTSTANGGGMGLDPGCVVTLQGRADISGNTAGGNAGGVRVYGSNSLIIDSPDVRITGNTATGSGGGIFQFDGLSTVAGATATTVAGNTASTCGNYYQYDSGNSSTCVLA